MNSPKSIIQSLWLFTALLISPASFAQLPDFTELVERNADSVVNVTAQKSSPAADDPSAMDPNDVPELFRRFFGPGFPDAQPRGPAPERISGGSGFIISTDGYVLTNHHVVADADEVTIRLKDRSEYTAKVIGSDPQSDIALLKVAAKGLHAATLGSSAALKPGQWVVAIGSPYGLDYSVTAGIVSAVGRSLANDQRYVPFIQSDVAINRGNSGGPLFNLAGEVVGINSQIFSNTGGSIGLSFSIPIDVAKNVVEQLRTKGKVSRGVIGVTIQSIDRARAEALGMERPVGALINGINKGSAGERAGLKVGDVITAFNGLAIMDSADLPPLVGATPPGQTATLGVFREGKTLNLPIVIGELQEGDGRTPGAADPPPTAPGNGAALGMHVRPLREDERQQLELDGGGVVVERVTGTAALRAGLQKGDIILMVGRQRVADVAGFTSAAKAVKPGQPVMLLVRRGSISTFIAIRPTEGSAP